MKIGSVSVAYNEPRFIQPHLRQLDPNVEKLVLNSSQPWQGDPISGDDTERLATASGATVLAHAWSTEHEQRNAGQEWFYDKDWIWILDPDEFLTREDQSKLKEFLHDAPLDAYCCERQLTYWKSGYVIEPPEDYKQIIAVRPGVRFWDKRCVDRNFGYAPVTLHHMSWARTDDEVWSKISHYSHGEEFDKRKWYDKVWKRWEPGMQNLHPLTPAALKQAVPATLPPELERLKIWPTT